MPVSPVPFRGAAVKAFLEAQRRWNTCRGNDWLARNPIQIDLGPHNILFAPGIVTVRAPTLAEAQAKLASNPSNLALARKIISYVPKELFRGAGLVSAVLGGVAAGLATGGVGIIKAISGVAQNVAAVSAASGGKVALNLGNLLGTAGSVIGGINTSGYGNFSQFLGGGLQIAGAAFAPQAQAPQHRTAEPRTPMRRRHGGNQHQHHRAVKHKLTIASPHGGGNRG